MSKKINIPWEPFSAIVPLLIFMGYEIVLTAAIPALVIFFTARWILNKQGDQKVIAFLIAVFAAMCLAVTVIIWRS